MIIFLKISSLVCLPHTFVTSFMMLTLMKVRDTKFDVCSIIRIQGGEMMLQTTSILRG